MSAVLVWIILALTISKGLQQGTPKEKYKHWYQRLIILESIGSDGDGEFSKQIPPFPLNPNHFQAGLQPGPDHPIQQNVIPRVNCTFTEIASNIVKANSTTTTNNPCSKILDKSNVSWMEEFASETTTQQFLEEKNKTRDSEDENYRISAFQSEVSVTLFPPKNTIEMDSVSSSLFHKVQDDTELENNTLQNESNDANPNSIEYDDIYFHGENSDDDDEEIVIEESLVKSKEAEKLKDSTDRPLDTKIQYSTVVDEYTYDEVNKSSKKREYDNNRHYQFYSITTEINKGSSTKTQDLQTSQVENFSNKQETSRQISSTNANKLSGYTYSSQSHLEKNCGDNEVECNNISIKKVPEDSAKNAQVGVTFVSLSSNELKGAPDQILNTIESDSKETPYRDTTTYGTETEAGKYAIGESSDNEGNDVTNYFYPTEASTLFHSTEDAKQNKEASKYLTIGQGGIFSLTEHSNGTLTPNSSFQTVNPDKVNVKYTLFKSTDRETKSFSLAEQGDNASTKESSLEYIKNKGLVAENRATSSTENLPKDSTLSSHESKFDKETILKKQKHEETTTDKIGKEAGEHAIDESSDSRASIVTNLYYPSEDSTLLHPTEDDRQNKEAIKHLTIAQGSVISITEYPNSVSTPNSSFQTVNQDTENVKYTHFKNIDRESRSFSLAEQGKKYSSMENSLGHFRNYGLVGENGTTSSTEDLHKGSTMTSLLSTELLEKDGTKYTFYKSTDDDQQILPQARPSDDVSVAGHLFKGRFSPNEEEQNNLHHIATTDTIEIDYNPEFSIYQAEVDPSLLLDDEVDQKQRSEENENPNLIVRSEADPEQDFSNDNNEFSESTQSDKQRLESTTFDEFHQLLVIPKETSNENETRTKIHDVDNVKLPRDKQFILGECREIEKGMFGDLNEQPTCTFNGKRHGILETQERNEVGRSNFEETEKHLISLMESLQALVAGTNENEKMSGFNVKDCDIPTSCCDIETKIVFPLFGYSELRGEWVEIVQGTQHHPKQVQPVVYRKCRSTSSNFVKGFCKQTHLFKTMLTMESSSSEYFQLDLLRLPGNCECHISLKESSYDCLNSDGMNYAKMENKASSLVSKVIISRAETEATSSDLSTLKQVDFQVTKIPDRKNVLTETTVIASDKKQNKNVSYIPSETTEEKQKQEKRLYRLASETPRRQDKISPDLRGTLTSTTSTGLSSLTKSGFKDQITQKERNDNFITSSRENIDSGTTGRTSVLVEFPLPAISSLKSNILIESNQDVKNKEFLGDERINDGTATTVKYEDLVKSAVVKTSSGATMDPFSKGARNDLTTLMVSKKNIQSQATEITSKFVASAESTIDTPLSKISTYENTPPFIIRPKQRDTANQQGIANRYNAKTIKLKDKENTNIVITPAATGASTSFGGAIQNKDKSTKLNRKQQESPTERTSDITAIRKGHYNESTQKFNIHIDEHVVAPPTTVILNGISPRSAVQVSEKEATRKEKTIHHSHTEAKAQGSKYVPLLENSTQATVYVDFEISTQKKVSAQKKDTSIQNEDESTKVNLNQQEVQAGKTSTTEIRKRQDNETTLKSNIHREANVIASFATITTVSAANVSEKQATEREKTNSHFSKTPQAWRKELYQLEDLAKNTGLTDFQKGTGEQNPVSNTIETLKKEYVTEENSNETVATTKDRVDEKTGRTGIQSGWNLNALHNKDTVKSTSETPTAKMNKKETISPGGSTKKIRQTIENTGKRNNPSEAVADENKSKMLKDVNVSLYTVEDPIKETKKKERIKIDITPVIEGQNNANAYKANILTDMTLDLSKINTTLEEDSPVKIYLDTTATKYGKGSDITSKINFQGTTAPSMTLKNPRSTEDTSPNTVDNFTNKVSKNEKLNQDFSIIIESQISKNAEEVYFQSGRTMGVSLYEAERYASIATLDNLKREDKKEGRLSILPSTTESQNEENIEKTIIVSGANSNISTRDISPNGYSLLHAGESSTAMENQRKRVYQDAPAMTENNGRIKTGKLNISNETSFGGKIYITPSNEHTLKSNVTKSKRRKNEGEGTKFDTSTETESQSKKNIFEANHPVEGMESGNRLISNAKNSSTHIQQNKTNTYQTSVTTEVKSVINVGKASSSTKSNIKTPSATTSNKKTSMFKESTKFDTTTAKESHSNEKTVEPNPLGKENKSVNGSNTENSSTYIQDNKTHAYQTSVTEGKSVKNFDKASTSTKSSIKTPSATTSNEKISITMFKESTKFVTITATESQSNEKTVQPNHLGKADKSVNGLISNTENSSTYIQDNKTNTYQTSVTTEGKSVMNVGKASKSTGSSIKTPSATTSNEKTSITMVEESTRFGTTTATESQSNEKTFEPNHLGKANKSVNELISNTENSSTYIQDNETNTYQTSVTTQGKSVKNVGKANRSTESSIKTPGATTSDEKTSITMFEESKKFGTTTAKESRSNEKTVKPNHLGKADKSVNGLISNTENSSTYIQDNKTNTYQTSVTTEGKSVKNVGKAISSTESSIKTPSATTSNEKTPITMLKESTKFGTIKATESQSNEKTVEPNHLGKADKSVNGLISNTENSSTYIQDNITNTYETSATTEGKSVMNVGQASSSTESSIKTPSATTSNEKT
ncbi:nuclear pore complex protein DDB_G0274915-like [Artemia franciscana]|uniref:nuclear pore complex protein DDB_G0274915-like n=1 Tax=Artemia franciscana TaxID=6661 RepID=UPI0032DBBF91